MKNAGVWFNDVSKSYRIGAGRDSIREMVTRRFGALFHQKQPENKSQILWALKDVSFDVEPGHSLGVVGSNGAGKTTLLKLLSHVTYPTTGTIESSGRMAALIELGAGFHPDRTGRENVYLNGTIMGLTNREIRAKYDDIVSFAELSGFMDTPVKRYSSGMYARLGFSVAAHVRPDILLVDEVLSVGDISFQKKCYDFLQHFVKNGHTTIFVSHNMYAIEQLSERLLWLDHGQVVTLGKTDEVLLAYLKAQDQKANAIPERQVGDTGSLVIEKVYLTDLKGDTPVEFYSGNDIVAHIEYSARYPIEHPHFVLSVWDTITHQPLFIASMLVDNQSPDMIVGQGELICTFRSPPLMPRTYQLWGEVFSGDRKGVLVVWQPFGSFTISDSGFVDLPGNLRHSRMDAPIRIPYSWSISGD